jgi:hypothetical protein
MENDMNTPMISQTKKVPKSTSQRNYAEGSIEIKKYNTPITTMYKVILLSIFTLTLLSACGQKPIP